MTGPFWLILSTLVAVGSESAHQHPTNAENAIGTGSGVAGSKNQLEVMCGPLLNYKGMSEDDSGMSWIGSVLIIVKPRQQIPRLELRRLGAVADVNGAEVNDRASRNAKSETVEGLCLYADPTKAFWRFTLRIPLADVETRWQYTIPHIHFLSEVSTNPSRDFVIPSASQSMRLMFHSCNGFSVGTDENFWSGETESTKLPLIGPMH